MQALIINFAAVASLLLGSSSFGQGLDDDLHSVPQNGECRSSDGKIQYSAYQYQGGPAPRPGMVVASQKLIIDGQLWAESRYHARGGFSVEDTAFEATIGVIQGSILEEVGDDMSGHMISAVLVTIRHDSMDFEPVQDWVICKNTWVLAP